MTAVLISGSRDWTDKYAVMTLLDSYLYRVVIQKKEPLHIFEGCARGTDHIAHTWADRRRKQSRLVIPHHHPARWDKYDKAAGPIRNGEMLADFIATDLHKPHDVWVFHDDLEESKGTRDLVERAEDRGYYVRHISRATLV